MLPVSRSQPSLTCIFDALCTTQPGDWLDPAHLPSNIDNLYQARHFGQHWDHCWKPIIPSTISEDYYHQTQTTCTRQNIRTIYTKYHFCGLFPSNIDNYIFRGSKPRVREESGESEWLSTEFCVHQLNQLVSDIETAMSMLCPIAESVQFLRYKIEKDWERSSIHLTVASRIAD